MKKDMSWFVYEPLGWQRRLGYSVDENRCRYQVPEGGRSVGFRQCFRKSVTFIQGHGFCRQHAARIQEFLEEEG